MPRTPDYTEVEVSSIQRETDKAILIETKDGRDVWVPLSQVSAIHHSEPPSLEIATWFVNKEDLA